MGAQHPKPVGAGSNPVGANSSNFVIRCLVLALWVPLLLIALVEPAPAVSEAAAACPDVLTDTADLQALKFCRQAARDSEGRKRARYYRTALSIGRAAYTRGRYQPSSGRKDAKKRWLAKSGQMFVHYGTLDCATAVDLEPADARATLDDCIDLLTAYILDLSAASAGDSPATAEMAKRRDQLRELRSGLPVEDEPVIPPPPPPPKPRPTAPPRDIVPPAPRGLYAGLGASTSWTVLSAVGLGVSAWLGARAQGRLTAPETVTVADAGKPICDLNPQPDGCAALAGAQRLYIASAIALGVGAVATAVFGGLLVRHRLHRGRPRTTVLLVPGRTGVIGGVGLRF